MMSSSAESDCPRLSVYPGSNSYSGVKHTVWPGAKIIPRMNRNISPSIDNRINDGNRKKTELKQSMSGFFQAQLLKGGRKKMKNSSKQQQGKLSRDRFCSSSSPPVPENHGKMKMTSNCNYVVSTKQSKMSPINYQMSNSTSTPILKRYQKNMTLFDTDSHSPILKKHTKMLEIPEELLAEILIRLPVKYILRCRCVQKSWCSLIQSPMFIALHLNYQKKNIATTHFHHHHHHNHHHHHFEYLFFLNQFAVDLTLRIDDVQCEEYCKLEFLPGLPKHAWFAVSYGLVCVSSMFNADYNRNIYLWNPLIKKYKTLPDSPLPSKQKLKDWEALAFGFVPEVNDYVVVHIIRPYSHPNHSVTIGVYSLNTNSWKKLIQDNVFISRYMSGDDDVVFVNGAAYWVALNSDKHKILMCFDTKTDILSEISLPDWVASTFFPVIHPFGHSIAYFVWENSVNHFDMWVLKYDPINEFTWEKKMCVSTSKDVGEQVLGVRNNGEPILGKSNNLITYNLDSHEAYDFVDSWDRCWSPHRPHEEVYAPRYVISPFVESLVLFDTY